MLVTLVRAALVAEIAAGLLLAWWLHGRAGWLLPAGLALFVALSLGVRLAIVCATMLLSWRVRARRDPGQQLGPRGTLRLILGEWAAMVANNFFYLPLESLALRADPPRAPTDRVPVLFLHGYFSNRAILRSLVRSLEAGGAGPLYTFNFRGLTTPIDALVAQLAGQVDEIARATTQPKVVLVCHSMGGLVARAYLARHGAGKVAKVVTMGSPHHGTALARLGPGGNARQMRHASEFLAALARVEGEGGPGCPVTSIYSVHDNLVAPQDTSRLPWARNVAIHGVGHVDMLRSGLLHRLLAEELREAGVAMAG